MKKVWIIGVGRVGGALALALPEKEYRVEKLFSRNFQKTEEIAKNITPSPKIENLENNSIVSADIVFITTQDSEIENVVNKLVLQEGLKNKLFFHMSGSLSSDILSGLKVKGGLTGSLHPLVSISDSFTGIKRFIGAYFCIEGDLTAKTEAKKIIKHLGGQSFSIETKYKTLYHASAVTACGHLVALINSATQMLETCGVEKKQGIKILLPLIKSTIENIENQGLVDALTGTFARGDLETLEEHIKTLERFGNKTQTKNYLELGEQSLELAREQGTDEKKLAKMSKKISLAKKNFKC
jgi:predicted short-subunit dehydrogenase-like oxidoreductase (DUF2520 family)